MSCPIPTLLTALVSLTGLRRSYGSMLNDLDGALSLSTATSIGWRIRCVHRRSQLKTSFGKGADMKRQNKNPFKAGSVERFHFNNSHWIRLPDDAWPKMCIQRDDVIAVQHQPRRSHVNLGSAAQNGNVIKTLRVAVLKKKKGFPTLTFNIPVLFLLPALI